MKPGASLRALLYGERSRRVGAEARSAAHMSGVVLSTLARGTNKERTMRVTVAIASIAMLASCAEPSRTQDPLFEPAPFSPVVVGHGSGKIMLADLNRDGHLDLVTQHLLDSMVNVLLGDGKGGFMAAAGSPMKLGYQPGTIALADVNNDRIADLGVANRSASGEYVDILLGDGRGGFTRSLGSPFHTSAAMEFYKPILRLVDVNEDGNADIVTANGRRHTIEVMLGSGAGGFTAQTVVSVGAGPGISSFAIGDVDDDGNVDLIASHSGGPNLDKPGSVVTKRGDGKGNFSDASHTALSLPPGAVLETLADMNGDGRVDAVITHGDRNMLRVLLNEGNGTFASLAAAAVQVDGQTFAVLVDDLNRDGKRDLIAATVQATAAPFHSQVAVFLGESGEFVRAPGSPFPAGNGAYNLAVGDVNEDGILDVATSSFEGNAVMILLGRR